MEIKLQETYEKLVPRLLWKLIIFLHIDLIIVPVLLRMYLIQLHIYFSQFCA